MPRRKKPDPGVRNGWKGECRAEDIDRQVRSKVRLEGQREYDAAYETAKRLKADGKSDEEIRQSLSGKEDKQAYSAEDSAIRSNQKEVDNQVAEDLFAARKQGVEDALANLAKNYRLPGGY